MLAILDVVIETCTFAKLMQIEIIRPLYKGGTRGNIERLKTYAHFILHIINVGETSFNYNDWILG